MILVIYWRTIFRIESAVVLNLFKRRCAT